MPKVGQKQCGCYDLCPTEYEPCGDQVTCDSSPCGGDVACAYVALFSCDYRKNDLYMQAAMVLWKECLHTNDSGWTNRRCLDALAADLLGCGFGNVGEDSPIQGTGDCGPMHPSSLPVNTESFPSGVTGAKKAYTCGWYDFFQGYEITESSNPDFPVGDVFSYFELTGSSSANFLCIEDYMEDWLAEHTQVVWRLVPDGSSAELRGYDNGVRVVTYSGIMPCDDTRETFEMENWPDADYPGLPQRVCITPYSSDWQSWCDTKADACDCGDNGANNVCLTSSVDGCPNYDMDAVALCRYFRDGLHGEALCDSIDHASIATLESDITCFAFPSPAPCGIFLYERSATLCAYYEDAGFSGRNVWIVWCDGDTWHLQIICHIECNAATCTHVDLGSFVFGDVVSCEVVVDVAADPFTIACDGSRFTFTYSIDSDVCCAACVYGCCDQTQFMDFVIHSDCANLDGLTVRLEYSAADGWWIGELDIPGCGLQPVRYEATSDAPCTGIFVFENCTMQIEEALTAGANDCCSGTLDEAVGVWDADACPCCPADVVITVDYACV